MVEGEDAGGRRPHRPAPQRCAGDTIDNVYSANAEVLLPKPHPVLLRESEA
jgi:hypothetical protein